MSSQWAVNYLVLNLIRCYFLHENWVTFHCINCQLNYCDTIHCCESKIYSITQAKIAKPDLYMVLRFLDIHYFAIPIVNVTVNSTAVSMASIQAHDYSN